MTPDMLTPLGYRSLAAAMTRDPFTMESIDTLGTVHYVAPSFGTISTPDAMALYRTRLAEAVCPACGMLRMDDPARSDCGSCA